MIFRKTLLIALVGVLAGFSNEALAQSGAAAPPRDEIAFTLKTGKENHVAIMNADGIGVTDVASCGEGECYPNWSPDGRKIVFERHDGQGAGIYVMDADGTNQQRLSPIPGFDVRPAFSPGGKQIVFNRVIQSFFDLASSVPATEIMLMNTNGENRHAVLAADGAFNVEPRLSPDGTKIVFMSNRDHFQQIYIMNADGTGLKKITDTGSNGDPAWSPDGSRLSFGSNREGAGKLNIYTMKRDGSDIRQLTHFSPPFEAGDTSWSADGKMISFERDVGGKGQSDPNVPAEIWIVLSDGSGEPVSTHQSCASVGCSPRFKPK